MLVYAYPRKEEVQKLTVGTFDDPRHWHLHMQDWVPFEPVIHDSTHKNIQMISVAPDDSILGFLSASIYREMNEVVEIEAIRYAETRSAVFSRDLFKFMADLFDVYRFRKITWHTIVGNPDEKMMDKVCLRYGGRIVGVSKQYYLLRDHRYYDRKAYEIFKTDFDVSRIQVSERRTNSVPNLSSLQLLKTLKTPADREQFESENGPGSFQKLMHFAGAERALAVEKS